MSHHPPACDHDPAPAAAAQPLSANASPAPDWDLVPFDVTCARCGHDLRRQSEPKCPACGLDFDWSEAVPLEHLTCPTCDYHLFGLREPRCPECGTEFDWGEAMLRYRAKRKPFFEYHWRDRPVRSATTTWFRVWSPRRIWKLYEIHDPPQVGALCVFATLCSIFSLASSLVPGWLARTLGAVLPLLRVGSPAWRDRVPEIWLQWLTSPRYWFPICTVAWLWCANSLAALLLFQQSMRRCRVRTGHVLRVWVHAIAAVTPIIAVAWQAVLSTHQWTWRGPSALRLGVAAVLVTTLLLFTVSSVRTAYRDYIRMDHPMGVAVAAATVALLGTATCSLLVWPGALPVYIVQTARNLGIPLW